MKRPLVGGNARTGIAQAGIEMKRIGYLYDKVMTYENVILAMEKYDENRPLFRRHGVDYRLAWDILGRMREDFAGIIGRPRIKFIYESGKQRRLQIPSYESCIAQIALWNVCGKYVERRIHAQSFSSRRGMGGHLAAKKCERFVHTNIDGKAKYHLYFDVRKFYQHIDKRIVMDRLATIFKDKKILEMFKAVVYSSDEGLPIGYPFSHALANFYLVPLYYLMRSIRNVSKIFVYMDNWTVFSRFKSPLKKAREAAKNWLAKVGCEMKHDWQIAPTAKRGVKICGFVIGKGKTRVYRKIWHRIMRNADEYSKRRTDKLYRSLMSRLGWVKAINVEFSPVFCTEKGYVWKLIPLKNTRS